MANLHVIYHTLNNNKLNIYLVIKKEKKNLYEIELFFDFEIYQWKIINRNQLLYHLKKLLIFKFIYFSHVSRKFKISFEPSSIGH